MILYFLCFVFNIHSGESNKINVGKRCFNGDECGDISDCYPDRKRRRLNLCGKKHENENENEYKFKL